MSRFFAVFALCIVFAGTLPASAQETDSRRMEWDMEPVDRALNEIRVNAFHRTLRESYDAIAAHVASLIIRGRENAEWHIENEGGIPNHDRFIFQWEWEQPEGWLAMDATLPSAVDHYGVHLNKESRTLAVVWRENGEFIIVPTSATTGRLMGMTYEQTEVRIIRFLQGE